MVRLAYSQVFIQEFCVCGGGSGGGGRYCKQRASCFVPPIATINLKLKLVMLKQGCIFTPKRVYSNTL